MLRERGEFESAECLAREIYELSKRTEDIDAKINAAYLIAKIESHKGHYDLASAWLDKAEGLAQSTSWPGRMAFIHYRRTKS